MIIIKRIPRRIAIEEQIIPAIAIPFPGLFFLIETIPKIIPTIPYGSAIINEIMDIIPRTNEAIDKPLLSCCTGC